MAAAYVVFALCLSGILRAFTYDMEAQNSAFYAEVGKLWLEGQIPYVGAFDVKPPGLFALVALAEAVFGYSSFTINGVQVFAETAVALGMYLIGRRMGATSAGAWAGVMFLAFSELCYHGNNVGYAPFVALTVFGFFAATRAGGDNLRAVAIAGLCLGCAFTIKQTSAIEGFALFCMLVASDRAAGRRVAVGVTYVILAALPTLAFLAYFAAHSAAYALMDAVVVKGFARSAGGPAPFDYIDGLVLFALQVRLFLPAAVLAGLALVRSDTIRRRLTETQMPLLGVWLAASVATALLQRSVSVMYFSPVMPPALLLACLVAVADTQSQRADTPNKRLALVFGAVLIALAPCLGDWPDRYSPAIDQVAAAINARKSPGDRLLVLADGLKLYSLTGLHPPTAFFHPMHLTCTFPGAGETALNDALSARSRFVVVRRFAVVPPQPDQNRGCHIAESLGMADRALSAGYRRLRRYELADGSFDLYEALPQTATRETRPVSDQVRQGARI